MAWPFVFLLLLSVGGCLAIYVSVGFVEEAYRENEVHRLELVLQETLEAETLELFKQHTKVQAASLVATGGIVTALELVRPHDSP